MSTLPGLRGGGGIPTFPKDYMSDFRSSTPKLTADVASRSSSRNTPVGHHQPRHLSPLRGGGSAVNNSSSGVGGGGGAYGGGSGTSHLHDALGLCMTIINRYKRERKGFSSDETLMMNELLQTCSGVTGSSLPPLRVTTVLEGQGSLLNPIQTMASSSSMDKEGSGSSPPAMSPTNASLDPPGAVARIQSKARAMSPQSMRLSSLFAKIRMIGAAPTVYKEMIDSKAEVDMLSTFSVHCARASLSVEQLAETVVAGMASLNKPPLKVSMYAIDALDEVLLDPISNISVPLDGNSELVRAKEHEGPFQSGTIKSSIIIPLRSDGIFVGTAVVEQATSLDRSKLKLLDALGSIAALSLRNFKLFDNVNWQVEKAEAMLAMANRLSRDNLDEHVLVQSIMATAKQLTESDRCSIFVVKGDQLQAYFEDGKTVTMSIDTGIAGHVAKTGETVNIVDAYEDARFNSSVDKATGYRTKTILCMPVLYEGTIVAVAQLINKKPKVDARDQVIERKFSKRDEELFITFSTFVGVSLRNCRINQDLVTEKAKSEAVLDVVRLLSNTDIRDVNGIVSHVMLGARKLLNADRASLFLLDKERNELYSKVADSTGGKEIRFPSGKGIAGTVASSGLGENIRDAYHDDRFNRDIDKQFGYRTRSILCEPIIFKEEVLAVAQLVNKLDDHGNVVPFEFSDMDTFRTFALFAGISISNSHLLEFAVRAGQEAMALNSKRDNIGLQRKGSSTVYRPVNESERKEVLEVVLPEGTDVTSLDFNLFSVREASEKPLNAAVAVVMQVIMSTGLPAKCNCDERVLLSFVMQCRRRYRQVPYHNFFHAVDVCQTMHTYLYKSKVCELLSDIECFVLLITALVHDLDHMGLNNSFHLKTDSPLGILSSASGNNSVLEVHHCNLAIEILEEPASDVFAGLDAKDKAKAYRGMIDCVLATDMARHGELLENFNTMIEAPYDGSNEDHRKLAMQTAIKACDISNVTKPFPISRLWAMNVTEEFYQQGDKEKARGVTVAPMFDRAAGSELAKGQIGFINFIAEKFFVSFARLHEGLSWTAANVKSNKDTWQEMLAPPPETTAEKN